jgi:hypothetical protein
MDLDAMAATRRAQYEEGAAHDRRFKELQRLKSSLPMYLYQVRDEGMS